MAPAQAAGNLLRKLSTKPASFSFPVFFFFFFFGTQDVPCSLFLSICVCGEGCSEWGGRFSFFPPFF